MLWRIHCPKVSYRRTVSQQWALRIAVSLIFSIPTTYSDFLISTTFDLTKHEPDVRLASLFKRHEIWYLKIPRWWVEGTVLFFWCTISSYVVHNRLLVLYFLMRWIGIPKILWLRINFCYVINLCVRDLWWCNKALFWILLLPLFIFRHTSNHFLPHIFPAHVQVEDKYIHCITK